MSFICTALENQGQSVGMRESPNYWEKIREENVGEKVRTSPYPLSNFFSAIFSQWLSFGQTGPGSLRKLLGDM